MSRNTVARIDVSALRHNLAAVRSMAPGSKVASVVKADAYGHGIGRVARALEGSDLLAVATIGEVQALRDSGWQQRILLLEGYSGLEEFEQVVALEAEVVMHQAAQLDILKERGNKTGLQTWLKIDTGMHRLGFPAADVADLHDELSRLCGSNQPVLMTHFACADDADNPMTVQQVARFDELTQDLPGAHSLANSATILNFPEYCRDYIRPGIMLYGISPLADSNGTTHGLKPVMSLSCELLAINHCAAGEVVGYGGGYRCAEDMRIGVAGIGYGDGYPRRFENGAPVVINGRKARLAGRVSMDLITIDLRGHDDARVGDEVVLWGAGLPVEEVAAHAGAIPYELVCGVTGRVRRTEI